MKNLLIIINILIISVISLQAQNNTKEVLIIGTMHQVPKFLKNSYKPLLKKAEKYQANAIYVERLPSTDTFEISMIYTKFYHLADSLKQVYPTDENRFNQLLNTNLEDFEKEDFRFMMYCFIIKKDYANYRYYLYLLRYGIEGSPKSLRNENDEITHRLAILSNMKMIYSMDDQSKRPEYYKAWQACAKAGKTNGDSKRIKRLGIKLTLRSIIPGLFGKSGLYTNSKKTIEAYHKINSFRYTQKECEACEEGKYYWDYRNEQMAINIGEQINNNTNDKNLVVVGAGHVVGIKDYLQKHYPNISVKILSDKKESNKEKNTTDVAIQSSISH